MQEEEHCETIKILSFDCGIKNLAYCLLEVDKTAATLSIVEWDIINIISGDKSVKSVKFGDLASLLMESLKLTFDGSYDYILIENQPCIKNPTMKSIQMMIYSYFLLYQPPSTQLLLISASNKLKPIVIPPGYTGSTSTSDYKKKKEAAVEITRFYLREVLKDQANEIKLGAEKKKDDLCDSFLQAIYFIKKELSLSF
jgi:hypothetical protein